MIHLIQAQTADEMDKSTMENVSKTKEIFMSDQILTEEKKVPAENSKPVEKTKNEPAACTIQGKGWLKGSFGMAICCGAPLLLIAAISFFGLSLGAIANGALSLAALLACPVGMFLMMRMMMKDKKED